MLGNLKAKGVAIRVASPKLVMEEAPESYKDVSEVGGEMGMQRAHHIAYLCLLLGSFE